MRRTGLAAFACAAFSLVAVSSGAAAPATISFDELSGTGNPILTSIDTTGFNFASAHEHILGDPESCAFGGCVNNGTNTLMEEAGGLGGPITMTSSGGKKFKLLSLDAGPAFLDSAAAAAGGFPNATKLHVVATTAKGDILATDLVFTGSPRLQAFDLPKVFSSVVSVTFYGNTTDNTGGISLDDISVSG